MSVIGVVFPVRKCAGNVKGHTNVAKMPAPMPVGALTMASFALTAAVIGNAYYQKKQFYPSVVYITKSNPSMAVSLIGR